MQSRRPRWGLRETSVRACFVVVYRRAHAPSQSLEVKMMPQRTRPVCMLALLLLPLSQQSTAQGVISPSGVCKPASMRTQQVGCWILADDPIGRLTTSSCFGSLMYTRRALQRKLINNLAQKQRTPSTAFRLCLTSRLSHSRDGLNTSPARLVDCRMVCKAFSLFQFSFLRDPLFS